MIALGWCRIALLGVLIAQPVWFGWLDRPEFLPLWLVLALSMLPLMAVLPGVWQLRKNPLVIAGCLLLVYFCIAVMEAWANPVVRPVALAQIALIGVFFTALPRLRTRSPRRG